MGQGNRTQTKDHIWAKTIYGIQHSGARKPDSPDPKTIGFNTVGTGKPDQIPYMGNRTQIPYMGKDHIWDSTQWDKETGPKPKTIFGQRPYMGFNTVETGKVDPKTIGFNTVGQGNQTKYHIWETGPKYHIWAKTTYGIQHSGTRKPDPNQRPYLGKDHIWDSTQWDKETGPKDDRIQHSWDRETRPKDHIWAKTIYGIQHSGTRKPDPKTIGFNTVGTGKPDPKTIYGQRPYMGFNTVGQGNRTQTKDHI